MDHHLVSEAHRSPFSDLVMELIEPTLDRLGWEPAPGDSDLTRQLRGLILGGAGRLARNPRVADRSRDVFEEWLIHPGRIDPEVAEACLYTVAASGDHQTYERLFSLYQENDSPQEKLRLLRSLTFVETHSSVDATLEAVLERSIRTQDASWVVGGLFRRRDTGAYAWEKAQEVWDDIVAGLPSMTVRYLVDTAHNLSGPQVAHQVTAFLDTADIPEAEKATAQALERLRAYILLRERQAGPLAAYLDVR